MKRRKIKLTWTLQTRLTDQSGPQRTDLKLGNDCVLVLPDYSLVVNPAADIEDVGREAAGDDEGGEPGGGEREEEAGETEQVRERNHPVSQTSGRAMVEAAADPLEDPTPTLSSLIGHTSRDTCLLLIQTRREKVRR